MTADTSPRVEVEVTRIKLVVLILLAAVGITVTGCKKSAESQNAQTESDSVVLYSSQDQFYAEPILKEFTAKTGIKVKSVFDTESAKTAGLANRLRAEKSNPQCDVFWSNEEMHAKLLVGQRIISSNDFVTAGFRTRRLVINTTKLSLATAPQSLLDLTNAVWNGRIVLAYPLFGTTSAHFVALRRLWGEELWKSWCYGLMRNGSKVVDGNSVVVKLVGRGEAWIGLTDFDDIAAGKQQALPIAALPPTNESLVIPSTVGIIKGAQNASQARALYHYLSKPDTLQKLVDLEALEGVEPTSTHQKCLRLSDAVAPDELEQVNAFLELIFIRS